MNYTNIKKRVFDILDNEEQNGILEKIVNIFIMTLIFLNVIAMIVETSIKSEIWLHYLNIFEAASIIIFTVEYILRLWVSDLYRPNIPRWKTRIRYAISGAAIIDFLATFPFYVPFLIKIDLRALRVLRLFRLLRIFKTSRYTNGMQRVISVIKNKSNELISSILVVATLMVMASALMYNIENAAQPEVFNNMFDAMWWATATLTTVGYGDIYPITVLGKILAAIIAILGIGIVAIPTGIIASGFTELIKNERVICPHCGKDINEHE